MFAFVLLGVSVWLLSKAGSVLVLNNPKPSDVLVVLEGGVGSSRFEQAIRLHDQGYAPRTIVDANIGRAYYGKSEVELVEDYVRSAGLSHIEVCPTTGDSTYAEAPEVKRCMDRIGATSAVIVTSDFHTRLALSVFEKRLPQYRWSVAASSWPANAAERYWKHRWWAKTVIDEWQNVLWWEAVDRWRSDAVVK